jgi:hypothetical protein
MPPLGQGTYDGRRIAPRVLVLFEVVHDQVSDQRRLQQALRLTRVYLERSNGGMIAGALS